VPVDVCIHGHFYQPPRENPWLGVIEKQPSAAPWEDWNQRIADECYAPNANCEIVTSERTVGLSNNYAGISFNFGPTLLAWMERARPQLLKAICEADRIGAARFGGHGPAIAQAYNHIIMPLAVARDKATQIRWGAADFRHRFGRAPEGMWLPETAVDLETLDLLAAEGIRFTILAPHQAGAVTIPGGDGATGLDTVWQEIKEATDLDTSRAYRVRLGSERQIAVFFYDGSVSGAVAFAGLLEEPDLFVERLIGFGQSPHLRHIATDGETYGHHVRDGEKTLARSLFEIDRHREAELTVYGAYLEHNPPDCEVRIAENTSWSCPHGLERWRSHCGCAGGRKPGSRQEWRAALRQALDGLRDRTVERFDELGRELFIDPWVARDAYIQVMLDPSPHQVTAFLDANARFAQRSREDSEVRRALGLMEQQRYAMLMYTSCGWFFDDPGDIETIQILQYAGRMLQLAEAWMGQQLQDLFLSDLAEVVSNDPLFRDGRRIWERHVRPHMLQHPEPCDEI
jgi:alpha-amylase/alpha-mannosidase (GH57 family)